MSCSAHKKLNYVLLWYFLPIQIFIIYTLPLLCTNRLQTIQRIALGAQPTRIDIYFYNWDIRIELAQRAFSYNIENYSLHRLGAGEIESRTDNMISIEQLSTRAQRMKTQSYLLNSQSHSITLNTQNSIGKSPIVLRSKEMKQNHTMYRKQYCCNKVGDVRTANKIGEHREWPSNMKSQMTVAACTKLPSSTQKGHSVTNSRDARNHNGAKASRARPEIVMTSKMPSANHNISMKKQNMDRSTTEVSTSPSGSKRCSRERRMPSTKTQNTFLTRLLFNDIIDAI